MRRKKGDYILAGSKVRMGWSVRGVTGCLQAGG